MTEEKQAPSAEQQYRDALRGHDWYYHYSDDGRSYRAGLAKEREVERTRKLFIAEQGEEKANEIWNEYAPNDCKRK